MYKKDDTTLLFGHLNNPIVRNITGSGIQIQPNQQEYERKRVKGVPAFPLKWMVWITMNAGMRTTGAADAVDTTRQNSTPSI